MWSARSNECFEGAARLAEACHPRRRTDPTPARSSAQSRERAAAALAELPASIRQIETTEPYPVEYSAKLLQLNQSL